MAILITNDGDKTVNTIADRDAITQRFEGMKVTVLDSIADILTGGGESCYQWNSAQSKWMLIWKTSKDNLIFTTETKTITNGAVTTDYIPSNGVLWDCYVTNPIGVVVADISYPTIVGKDVDLGSNVYEGYTLTYTYGYGMIEAAVYANSDRSWVIKTTNYTLFAGDKILANTSNTPITLTLPAVPYIGATVKIIDYKSTFGTNAITLVCNSEKILGSNTNLVLSTNNENTILLYTGTEQGWVYGL